MLASWRALYAIPSKLHPRSLATSPFPRLSRVSGLMRPQPGTLTRRYHAHESVTSDEDDDISDLGAEFFGTYSVILPPEPFVMGVSHIVQRPVPEHIPRPSYMTPSAHGQSTLGEASGDGRIQLGSSAERRLRQAARLARDVLEYAGTLVKVKAGFVVRVQH
jgi:methionyl aminopeptidase